MELDCQTSRKYSEHYLANIFSDLYISDFSHLYPLRVSKNMYKKYVYFS